MSAYDVAAETPVRSIGNHFSRKGFGNNTVIDCPPLPMPAERTVDEHVAAIYQDGFTVIKNAIPRDQVPHVKEIMASFKNHRDGDGYSSWGYGKDGERREDIKFIQRSGGGPCGHPDLLPYTNIPIVMDILNIVLAHHFHIVGGTCWLTGPGRHPMGLHSDWMAVSLPEDVIADPRVVVPVYECFAHFYLNDMTPDMGPTVVVPGSHRSGRIPQNETSWNGNDAGCFCCEAGDMILFNNAIWHGAMPNISDEVRYLYQIQYANKRIGTVHGQALAVKDEVIAQANDEQKRLLGVVRNEGGYY